MNFEQAIIIRSKTRLEQLIERFNTKAQAKFYIERSGGRFDMYEKEHQKFYDSLHKLQDLLTEFPKTKTLDRSFLPNYIFTEQDLIIIIGQDGLVANAAKYVKGQPIIAINPDPETYDGILLPYTVSNVDRALAAVQSDNYEIREVTMAEARFSDGQTLLAFNDFFIGARSHVSARYQLTFNGTSEPQSSSGIIVSTGAGSTGWMSSIMNMVNGISNYHYGEIKLNNDELEWEDEMLVFAVREPFRSKTSEIDLCYGEIEEGETLKIESYMPDNGIVFSDGIEADAVQFNTGVSVEIGVAGERACLVVG